ncbi:hypothetical protein LOK49_LG07G01168 [Camellia lanceoleosa]|uniref:Uncharacterized protein n=1 Tax=Camellia lanceoleosa TaxID=1840588 RepID=A0ACC0H2C1_9ERIC|nr:hypothetical protein LOK49_LG07G01168 [Camellia lanceoleosa]
MGLMGWPHKRYNGSKGKLKGKQGQVVRNESGGTYNERHRERKRESVRKRIGRVGLKMGSSVEAIQAAKVYRHLLKAVKKHVGKEEQKSHFIEFISQEFRTSHEQLDLSSIHQKIKLARDYTFLLNSVHHHKDLLFSYNIAVDRSDEMKKVLGKSAASVGLQLPEVYQS